MKEKISPTQRALNLWAVVLIIWAIYRANIRMLEPFDEFIAKPLVFIAPVWYYITRIEKKDFWHGIDFRFKTLSQDIILGLVIGGIFFVSAVLANFVKTHQLMFLSGQKFSPEMVLLTLGLAFATAISEEILSRGFILKRLYDESKNIYTSSFFASILFFFLHVPILFTNPKINGNLLLLFMGTDMVLSLTSSFVFLTRRSLVLPILIHAFYNLAIIFFL